MATIVLRAVKGSPLTIAEVDANFTNLNNALTSATPTIAGVSATGASGTGNVVFSNSPTITSPTLVTPILGTPTSGNFSTGTFTWPTFNQNTTGTAAGLSATLIATSGGTGISTTAIGDLLQGSATNTWSKLAAVATGNVLISGGITTASSWGKVGLTTHISGTLAVANGGTNASVAGITAFNNITGYSALGATGTTSTNLVFSNSPTITSPTLVTPILGTPTSGDFSSGTFTWPTFNQNTTGNASTATTLVTARNINGVAFDGSAAITINAVDSTARIASSLIGAANGVAPLGSDSKIASIYLPSYVDDVLEGTSLSVFPATGEVGKIYVAIDTNKSYRWSGTVYVEISASPGSTDSVTEGTTNLYFTSLRAQNAVTSVSGNAGTATKLATARSIAMTGDVTWSISSFDGSANVTSSATLATITDSGTGTFKKITTNTKGLVTGTTSVVQADITGLLGAGSISNTMLANSAVANLSGTNTGNETATTIKNALGITTLSGSNTGDQTSVSGNAGTATSLAGGVANNIPYQTASGTTAFVAVSTVAGQVLTTSSAGGAPTWISPAVSLPSQTGNNGKYLKTDGTNASWTDTLTAVKLSAYQETVVTVTASTATTTLDMSLGSVFVVTISANTAFAFSNFPANTSLSSFTIITVNDATAGRAVTWPAAVTWAGGLLPARTTTANKSDAWAFFTINAGTKIVGSLSVANY